MAALGGAILLVSLLLPIDWFNEENLGGFAGRLPSADRSLTAWDAFGSWVVPVALAAALPLVNLALRPLGRGIPWEIRIIGVSVGLGILFVATWSELAYTQPGCCDIPYYRPLPHAGFLIGGIGGTVLFFATLASWPRRFPWEPHRVAGAR